MLIRYKSYAATFVVFTRLIKLKLVRLLLIITWLIYPTMAYSDSAYPIGPYLGNDNFFHMIWMWRKTEDADTNHSFSYAKSKDLVHWQTCDSHKTVAAPLKPTDDLIVEKGYSKNSWGNYTYNGLLNSRQKISLLNETTIVSYILNTAQGTQVFNARLDGCNWKVEQATNWCETLNISGGGTLPITNTFEFSKVFAKQYLGEITYFQKYIGDHRACAGEEPINGLWILDKNFKPLKKVNLSTLKPSLKVELVGNLIPLDTFKTVKLSTLSNKNKNQAIVWAAKKNERDKAAKCLGETCKENDFLTELYFRTWNGKNKTWDLTALLNNNNPNNDSRVAWAGSQSKFFLGNTGTQSYIIYYSNDMCLAFSKVTEGRFINPVCLAPMSNKWDSHNYVTATEVSNGLIYVTGNMHNNPLSYFVIDIKKGQIIKKFKSNQSDKFTYPKFLKMKGELFLLIRNGKSGKGIHEVYKFDANHSIRKHITLFSSN